MREADLEVKRTKVIELEKGLVDSINKLLKLMIFLKGNFFIINNCNKCFK